LGQTDDKELANDVRSFLGLHQGMNATPEIFAAYHRQMLQPEIQVPIKTPEPRTPDKGRSR
jgi:type IV secretion system T-DNA border endonuclease VirD2